MMWPRWCEILLAVWLAVSVWVFDYSPAHRLVTLAAAAAVLFLDWLSITFRRPYAYLAILGIVAALLAFAWFVEPPYIPANQNNVVVALLLLMFAILPTEALAPSKSWREFRARPR
jgi:hypothetical protein